jgi:hypothetical protein
MYIIIIQKMGRYAVSLHFKQYFTAGRSVLLVEVTGVPGENLSQVTVKLYHNVVSSTHRLSGIRTHHVRGIMHMLL